MSTEILELKASLYDKQQEIQSISEAAGNYNKFALDVATALGLEHNESLSLESILQSVKELVESKSCSLESNDEASGD